MTSYPEHTAIDGDSSDHPTDEDGSPDGEADDYASDTPLTWLFGNHPEVKLVATLLSERDQQLNKREIVDLAGVSPNAIYDHLDPLKDYGVVEKTATTGNIDLFQFADTDVTRTLRALEQALLKQWHDSDVSIPSIDELDEADDPEGIDDPYAEDTPLTWLFGDHPEAKILSALLSERDTELTITGLARIAGVSRSPIYNHKDDLETLGVFRPAGQDGKKKLYRTNPESPIVHHLLELERALLRAWFENTSDDGDRAED